VLALRGMRRGSRADLSRPGQPAELGNAALAPSHDDHAPRPLLPESVELRRSGDDGLDEPSVIVHPDQAVRPISRLGETVEPIVIDDFATEPASDPVIGPELAAARTRVGLSVDELAERTRIRPHVIESIEVDDFAPCGGDFYARGHLRTLARVLGRDPEPLLAMFDNRYATAPIAASRVFEAELATGGMAGGMRRTTGGPNWALLVGVVLALVMVWGVLRLFASAPQEVLQPSTPVLNGSAGVDGGSAAKQDGGAAVLAAPKPMHVTLVGAQDGSQVVVRDRNGKVVWAGEIVLGEKRTVQALPPVKVEAKVGGVIEAYVKGRDRGAVGAAGQAGVLTLTRLTH
jgi:helix-turn-helix protein